MKNKKALTAPCRLACFICSIYEDNSTSDLARTLYEALNVPKEEIPCKGCRQQEGKHFHLPPEGCTTPDCVKSKVWIYAVTAAIFLAPYLHLQLMVLWITPTTLKFTLLAESSVLDLSAGLKKREIFGKNISRPNLLLDKGRQINGYRRNHINSVSKHLRTPT